MALNKMMWRALVAMLKEIPEAKVASWGYPDIIAEIDKDLKFEYREDSENICKRHGISNRKIPDAKSVFAAYGASLDVFDIVKERDCEIIADLNQPLVISKYDVVLDPGTLEHCFNVAQAAFNMAGMVKKDGFILHDNPFVSGNHGFYGMNPTWYADFYGQNGFDLISCGLYNRQIGKEAVHLTGRFPLPHFEHYIFAVAKRTKVQELIYPTQTKYKTQS